MEARRCGGVVLAAALAIACAMPPGIAQAEQFMRTYAQGEAIPGELVVDGETYSLESWETGGGFDAVTRTFEKTVRKAVPAGDYDGQARGYFDAELSVDEEGFAGTIPLASAKAEVSRSRPERSDYEEAVEFEYITKDELDALPSARQAVVAGREVTLGKLDVQAVRQPSDPGTEIYSGRAVYGIHEQVDVADEYELTAVYSGELSRGASPGTVVAVYEPVAQGASGEVPAAVEIGQRGPEAPAWAVAMATVSLVAVCASFVLVVVSCRKAGQTPGLRPARGTKTGGLSRRDGKEEGDDGDESEG